MPLISNPTHVHSSHLAAPLSQALNTTNLSITSLFQVLMHCHWSPPHGLAQLFSHGLMASLNLTALWRHSTSLLCLFSLTPMIFLFSFLVHFIFHCFFFACVFNFFVCVCVFDFEKENHKSEIFLFVFLLGFLCLCL